MSAEMGPPRSWADALDHPLRQALFTLLCHRPATARELQPALKEPLNTVVYHLGLLADSGCVRAHTDAGIPVYSVNREAIPALLLAQPGEPGRVMVLSFLDAAWAAMGRPPLRAADAPSWRTFRLDEVGLREASAAIAACLKKIDRIAEERQERGEPGSEGAATFTLVSVTSPLYPPDSRRGESAG